MGVCVDASAVGSAVGMEALGEVVWGCTQKLIVTVLFS